MKRRLFLAGSLLLPRLSFAASEKDLGIEAARKRMRALAAEKKIAWPFGPRIEIRKADRELDLFAGKTLLKRYTCALGLVPDGHKQVQGDYKTPEGDYRICYRNYGSAFHLFLGLSYPNGADAAAALEKKLIDAKTAKSIANADKEGRPAWGSALGGAVGIHGGGVGNDWTWGCIALTDDDVDELWAVCAIGTAVKITA